MSLCGFACCHCGKCGTDIASRYGITAIAGKCPDCQTVNGPKASVCKQCGATLIVHKTVSAKPSSQMSKPSILQKRDA